MYRYNVVPHGDGAAHIPSCFVDSVEEANKIRHIMLLAGANSVLVYDITDGRFICTCGKPTTAKSDNYCSHGCAIGIR